MTDGMSETEMGKVLRATFDFVCKVCGKESSKYLSFYEVNGKKGPRTEFMAVSTDSITDFVCVECMRAGKHI